MDDRRQAFLDDIAKVATYTALSCGTVDQAVAEQIGAVVVDVVIEEWADQVIYFLHRQSYRLSEREKTMLEVSAMECPTSNAHAITECRCPGSAS